METLQEIHKMSFGSRVEDVMVKKEIQREKLRRRVGGRAWGMKKKEEGAR